ncbi:MAG: cardiolipin synthase [Gammaproteobacteria bacterium]
MDTALWHIWIGLVIAAIHLLGLIAAAHAALTARTSQGAIAWALSLVFMPYLALVPYLIFGRSKFTGYVETRRARNRQLHEHASAFRQTERARAETEAQLGHRLAGIRTLATLTGLPFSRGNDVRLLINGGPTFDAILVAIAAAKQYVIVQFFVVADDGLGRRLQSALIAKATEGVPVYFLYDGIGSHALPESYVAKLRDSGVQVQEFLIRRRSFINRYQFNFRNHRKIVVVDGERAFVGGHNVSDEYLGLMPPLSPWRDTHIEIAGPAVAGIQLAFVEDWYWATGHVPTLRWEPVSHAANMHCQVIPSGPADTLETCALFFVQAINAARARLWITTPYLIPDDAVFSALKLAVLRGVDVRILIPNRADHFIVFNASSLYAHEAIGAGIKVYRYQSGFLHEKVLLIDDDAAAVGSANLDNRSFRLNFELIVLTVDTGFAAQIASMLKTDFAQSRRVELEEYTDASILHRVLMGVARLFDPIL